MKNGMKMDYNEMRERFYLTTVLDFTETHMLLIFGCYEHLHIHYHNTAMSLLFINDRGKFKHIDIEEDFFRSPTNKFKRFSDHEFEAVMCFNYENYTDIKPNFCEEDKNGQIVEITPQLYNVLNSMLGNSIEACRIRDKNKES